MNNQQNNEHSDKKIDAKKKKFKFIPSLSEYLDRLNFHKWSFDQDNFKDYTESAGKERFLYELAMTAGPEYMRAFAQAQQKVIFDRIDLARRDEYQRMSINVKEAQLTGDPEFDQFAELVRHHDWYWQYSDDGGVARRGSEAEDKIRAIVKEKGGIYKTYYEWHASKNQR